jgi:signal transduction histidine kinase
MSTNRPARILVVDDEPDLELLITQRFRAKIKTKEFTFEFAGNGIEALRKLHSGTTFDLLLTDINMPGMDGLTLLTRLKDLNILFKAIVVSAYGDLQNIRTAMNSGAFDFITKPIDFQDLETTIYKTLNELNVIRTGIEAQNQLQSTILEKERAEMEKHKAEQSEKFKQQFLANMSHEIRTPINSIIGMTNLILRSVLNDTQSKYLSIVKKSSSNLLVIINDILDLSKIEAGKMEFEKTPFVLADSLETAYHTLLYKSEEKELGFDFTVDQQLPVVLIGDPVRLNQVIINLASNAIKFTEKGFVHITAKQTDRTPDSVVVEFAVSDTGIGIAEDKISKVFESFAQASSDTTRKYGGTGLGLTISRQLVEMQGGLIRLDSKLGKGSTFSFSLSFGIGDETMLKQEDKEDLQANIDTLDRARILLVEDNHFNQMVAVDTLMDMVKTIDIEVADNGKIAIEKIRNGSYQLVLMDVHMPEMDGYETSKYIRTQMPDGKKSIPIMAMTASVTNDEIQNCFNAGMNEYISKPFDPNDLVRKIAKLLKKYPIQNPN